MYLCDRGPPKSSTHIVALAESPNRPVGCPHNIHSVHTLHTLHIISVLYIHHIRYITHIYLACEFSDLNSPFCSGRQCVTFCATDNAGLASNKAYPIG